MMNCLNALVVKTELYQSPGDMKFARFVIGKMIQFNLINLTMPVAPTKTA